MIKQSRIGDLVSISCPHGPQTGIITSGSSKTYFEMISGARLSDTVVCCGCGQSGNIITGSTITFYDGLPAARVGDSCVGTCDVGCKTCPHSRSGTLATGSEHTDVDR